MNWFISHMRSLSKRSIIILAIVFLLLLFILNFSNIERSALLKEYQLNHKLSLFVMFIEDTYIYIYYILLLSSSLNKFKSLSFHIPKVCYQTWVT